MSQFIEMFTNNNFEMVPLGDLCDKISDGSHNPPKGIENSKYLMISSKNVFKDHLDLTDVRYLTEEDFEVENKRTNVKANDVLLTIVGTIGRTYLVKGNEGNLVMQRSVAVLTPNSRVTPLFLMFYLHSDKNLEKEGRGNAQKGIYLKRLSQYEIKVPSIDLQKQFEAIYRQADKSEFDGFKSQFIEMFKDTPIVKLEDYISTQSGGTPNTKKHEYYDDGDIPWLSSGEVNQGYIDSTEKFITQAGLDNSSAKWVPKDCVVIAMYGATAGKVGYIRIPLTTNQAVCSLLPSNEFNSIFLYYAVSQKTDWMISQCRGAAQPNISQGIIRSMELPLPSMSEQNKFVAIAEQADKSESELRKSIESINKVIKSLINENL